MAKTNQITIIIAKKGVGKTTIASALALTQNKKVFWITPLPKSYPKRKYDRENTNPKEWNKLSKPDTLQSQFIVEAERENLDRHLQRVMNYAHYYNGACLVIDELDFYVNSHLKNQTKLFEVINYGRHYELDLIVIARRLQDIPTNLATNCDYFVLGKNANIENDTKYYKQFFTNEIIELSKSLEVGQFYRIESSSQKIELLTLNAQTAQKMFNEV